MAHTKAYFVKKARKDIYENGVTYKNERGFNITVKTCPADENDQVVIKKGESYWWWKWRFGSKRVSKTEPNASELSRYGKSEWEEKIEEFESRKANVEDGSDVGDKEDLLQDIEEHKSELENRLTNIPEPLQESSVLNERIEELQGLYTEIENMEGDEEDE